MADSSTTELMLSLETMTMQLDTPVFTQPKPKPRILLSYLSCRPFTDEEIEVMPLKIVRKNLEFLCDIPLEKRSLYGWDENYDKLSQRESMLLARTRTETENNNLAFGYVDAATGDAYIYPTEKRVPRPKNTQRMPSSKDGYKIFLRKSRNLEKMQTKVK